MVFYAGLVFAILERRGRTVKAVRSSRLALLLNGVGDPGSIPGIWIIPGVAQLEEPPFSF